MKIDIAQLADGASVFIAHRPTPRPLVRADEPTRDWSDVTDELLRLRRLEDDWDGQGAVAPPLEAVHSALSLALELKAAGMPPADRALAGVSGTVFLEWHDAGRYLEIEVLASDRTEGRWVYADTNQVEEFTLTR